MPSMSREPARVQFPEGMASPVPTASPAGVSGGGPRNLKQERTAQNFLRGCARLRMIQVCPCWLEGPPTTAVTQKCLSDCDVGWLQETEKGMLFAQKSRWKDLTGGIRQHAATVGSSLSLWKTSIQTIEARHGEQRWDDKYVHVEFWCA